MKLQIELLEQGRNLALSVLRVVPHPKAVVLDMDRLRMVDLEVRNLVQNTVVDEADAEVVMEGAMEAVTEWRNSHLPDHMVDKKWKASGPDGTGFPTVEE